MHVSYHVQYNHMGVSINGCTPKWICFKGKIMDNPSFFMEGKPPVSETSRMFRFVFRCFDSSRPPAVLAKDQRHVDAEHHRGEAEIAQQRTLRQVRAVDASPKSERSEYERNEAGSHFGKNGEKIEVELLFQIEHH